MSSHLIAWCGFLGAWLLVAGPIYQAAIDLDDEEFERDDLVRAASKIESPPPVSRWWLLLPPVAYVLHRRRRETQQQAMLEVMSRSQLEKLVHFGETARAWLFVASGAFLLAIEQTWELRESYGWPMLVFWVGIATMIVICAANIGLRIQRRNSILERAGETKR